MTKLPILSAVQVVKALKKAGFDYAPRRGKGSHLALSKEDETGRKILVVIPQRKEIPKGTLISILEQARISKEAFLKLI